MFSHCERLKGVRKHACIHNVKNELRTHYTSGIQGFSSFEYENFSMNK